VKAAAKVVLDQLKDALSRIRSVKIKPGLKSVYRDPAVGWLLMVIGALLFILFVPCAIYLYFHHNDRPVFSFVLAALWTVAVPIYFFLEHELFFFYLGDAAEYERFTRVQDLAAKIWAGAIGVLGAIVAIKLHGGA